MGVADNSTSTRSSPQRSMVYLLATSPALRRSPVPSLAQQTPSWPSPQGLEVLCHQDRTHTAYSDSQSQTRCPRRLFSPFRLQCSHGGDLRASQPLDMVTAMSRAHSVSLEPLTRAPSPGHRKCVITVPASWTLPSERCFIQTCFPAPAQGAGRSPLPGVAEDCISSFASSLTSGFTPHN